MTAEQQTPIPPWSDTVFWGIYILSIGVLAYVLSSIGALIWP